MELFGAYEQGAGFDEAMAPSGKLREYYVPLARSLTGQTPETLARRQKAADLFFLHRGTTFTVYGERAGIDRIFPFDSVPRIIPAHEWCHIELGLKQRLRALNLFLQDIYSDQKILKDGVVPADLVLAARHFRRECIGLPVPLNVYVHVCGTDLI